MVGGEGGSQGPGTSDGTGPGQQWGLRSLSLWENGERWSSLVSWRAGVGEACMSDREAGAREGGPEPAKECEARAPGKSQGRKGGGQRKRDLATAPSSLTRK